MDSFEKVVDNLYQEVSTFNTTQVVGAGSSRVYTLSSGNAFDYDSTMKTAYWAWVEGIPNINFYVIPHFSAHGVSDNDFIPTQIYLSKLVVDGVDLFALNPEIPSVYFGHRKLGCRSLSGQTIWFRDVTSNPAACFQGTPAPNARYYQMNLLNGPYLVYGSGSSHTVQLKFEALATVPGYLEVVSTNASEGDWNVLNY